MPTNQPLRAGRFVSAGIVVLVMVVAILASLRLPAWFRERAHPEIVLVGNKRCVLPSEEAPMLEICHRYFVTIDGRVLILARDSDKCRLPDAARYEHEPLMRVTGYTEDPKRLFHGSRFEFWDESSSAWVEYCRI